MKYEDLKCEFCDGAGEKEKYVEPFGDSPVTCTFCNGTGIDQEQLINLFHETHTITEKEMCSQCYCSFGVHRHDGQCPEYFGGEMRGWLETTFSLNLPRVGH